MALDELHPKFLRACMRQAHFWSKISLPFVRHSREAFLLAKVVKQYGLPKTEAEKLVDHAILQHSRPDDFVHLPHADQILAAFFCFSLVDLEMPMLELVLDNVANELRDQYFCWRWHTHKFCSLETQARVNAAASVLQMFLPTELTEKILSRATTENEVEML